MKLQDVFQRDKELCKWWASISPTDSFEKVLMFATGILTEGEINTQELHGVKKFKEILQTMANEQAFGGHEPASGLHHDVLAAAMEMRVKESEQKK